ncbi:MAG: type II toxin-antitoxin system HicB family antitoxin [Verrucomicrobiae bacterium]|nr:type II toxin-antitoxin system HicB family antitoxin [Verrucomicrobiae bacterium]
MKKYLVVIEDTETGYSAYSPDIPGCVATGESKEELEHDMREAIEFHLDGLRQDGEPLPVPHSYPMYCEVTA